MFFALTCICFAFNYVLRLLKQGKPMNNLIERAAEFVFLIALLAIPMFFSGGF